MERIRKILDRGIESIITDDHEDGYKSAGYKKFNRMLTNDVKKLFLACGAENIQVKQGYFYASGFFTYKGKAFYFSFSDFRHFPSGAALIRTARDYFDYTGGRNHFFRVGVESVQEVKHFLIMQG